MGREDGLLHGLETRIVLVEKGRCTVRAVAQGRCAVSAVEKGRCAVRVVVYSAKNVV